MTVTYCTKCGHQIPKVFAAAPVVIACDTLPNFRPRLQRLARTLLRPHQECLRPGLAVGASGQEPAGRSSTSFFWVSVLLLR